MQGCGGALKPAKFFVTVPSYSKLPGARERRAHRLSHKGRITCLDAAAGEFTPLPFFVKATDSVHTGCLLQCSIGEQPRLGPRRSSSHRGFLGPLGDVSQAGHRSGSTANLDGRCMIESVASAFHLRSLLGARAGSVPDAQEPALPLLGAAMSAGGMKKGPPGSKGVKRLAGPDGVRRCERRPRRCGLVGEPQQMLII